MRLALFLIALLYALGARAQPQPQMTASQLALQINSAIAALAQQNDSLQAQLAAANARIKELEEAAAAKKPPAKE